jgi:hypothetical protein
MLRTDLEAARANWIAEARESDQERQRREQSDFLCYRNQAGDVADAATYIVEGAQLNSREPQEPMASLHKSLHKLPTLGCLSWHCMAGRMERRMNPSP